MIILDEKGHGDKSEIYAYIAIDENGKSGICAGQTAMGFLPMVGMTRKDMKKWLPAVKQMREATGRKIQLVRYTAAEILEDLEH